MDTEVRSVADGSVVGSVTLPDAIFGIEPNVAVMHQVVTAQLAAARSGTHSTKTRAEVSGGGAKPWRQKGSGRARQGSTRAPHWRGGGVAHGPVPRSYKQKTPRRMVWLALRSALSDRASSGMVVVVDGWGFTTPRTKDALAALSHLGVGDRDRTLVVLERGDDAARKSFRNLGARVRIVTSSELNTYDVLVNDRIVFTRSTLAVLSARVAPPEASPVVEAVPDTTEGGAA